MIAVSSAFLYAVAFCQVCFIRESETELHILDSFVNFLNLNLIPQTLNGKYRSFF